MKPFVILTTLAIACFASADIAPKSPKNPKKVIAVADFPQYGTSKLIKGYVFFTSATGNEVKVHIDFTGLPKVGGPFHYHIHENTVSSDTCEDAGVIFDPYHGLHECPLIGDDATCKVGDLSGKHGWINTTCFQTEYIDPFVSLDPKNPAYLIGKSIVIHHADGTRFACANINVATKEQYKQLFDLDAGVDAGDETASSDSSVSNTVQTDKIVSGGNSDSGNVNSNAGNSNVASSRGNTDGQALRSQLNGSTAAGLGVASGAIIGQIPPVLVAVLLGCVTLISFG